MKHQINHLTTTVLSGLGPVYGPLSPPSGQSGSSQPLTAHTIRTLLSRPHRYTLLYWFHWCSRSNSTVLFTHSGLLTQKQQIKWVTLTLKYTRRGMLAGAFRIRSHPRPVVPRISRPPVKSSSLAFLALSISVSVSSGLSYSSSRRSSPWFQEKLCPVLVKWPQLKREHASW